MGRFREIIEAAGEGDPEGRLVGRVIQLHRRVRSRGDWENQLRLKSRLGPRLWYRGEAAV